MRFRWYRVDGDGELRVSDGGNKREVRIMYERKRECHGSTGSPSALSEEDSKRGRDGSRGGKGSS